MFEFLPPGLRAELEAARRHALGRKSRLRIHAGGRIFPILRYRPDWFSLDVAEVDHLRGLVDLYEGARHLSQLLIVASEVEDSELICRVKRTTPVLDRAPLDFARDEAAPVALLPG